MTTPSDADNAAAGRPATDHRSAETRRIEEVIAPLLDDEESSARSAAAEYLADRAERFRILGVEVRVDKPDDPQRVPQRQVRVLVIDYSNRITRDVMVDPAGVVVEARNLGGYQPVFLAEEVEEARAVAEADERVARAASLPGLFVSTFAAERPAGETGRAIGLRYATVDDGAARVLAHVTVNLCDGEITGLEEGDNHGGIR
jgi:hypothetical protein